MILRVLAVSMIGFTLAGCVSRLYGIPDIFW